MSKANKHSAGNVQVQILTDNHTHKGKPCKKGDVITCSPDIAEWLIKREKPVGKVVDKVPEPSPAKTDAK